MSTIYITGIRGFIGTNLALKLKKKKFKVKEFKQSLLKEKNFSKDILVHLGQSSNSNSIHKKDDLKFIKKLKEKNFLHYVYISSIKVYEKNILNKNIKNYIHLKKQSEKSFDFNKTTILRCCNVYGIGQKKPTLLSTIINQLQKKEKLYLDNLSNMIDYLWIGDLTDLILKTIKLKKNGIFDISSQKKYSVKQICKKIIKLKKLSKIKLYEKKINITKPVKLNYSKAINEFSWIPKTSLDKGLKKLLNEKK